MKITHISLCGPVTDNLTYQDNLLPKYHKKMGLEVSMITSKFIWEKGSIGIDNRSSYYNEYGIKTIRIDNKNNSNINSKFKRYKKLYKTIENEAPDILFVHGVQFLDIKNVVKYVKNHPDVKIYVDNHADFSNSATNWVSKNILHKIFWRYCAKLIEPYTQKFYGVLPARVDFLENIYKIPKEKVELLILGADDEKINEIEYISTKKEIRDYYNIGEEDFLIITGGKIDYAKLQVLNLMKAVNKLDSSKIKLIVYGSIIPELESDIQKLTKNSSIEFIGWLSESDSYRLFSIADLVVFPGRHSVYWEQVVAFGIPVVVKYWEGTTHVDIGGNCVFLYEDSEEEIFHVINNIVKNQTFYNKLLTAAQNSKKKEFLYSNIAKKSISYES